MFVSIVVPSHNAGKYLNETIRSVLSQTHADWELIIIDDGSTDNTKEILAGFNSEKRIKYFYQSQQGVSMARNNGISRSAGDCIAFLDADDIWEPRNLEKKIGLLQLEPSVDWVFSNMMIYDEKKNTKTMAPSGRDDKMLENLLLWEGEVVPGPSSNMIIRKKCFTQELKFDPLLSTGADLDFTIELAKKFTGRLIPEFLWSYRVSHNSMSRNISVLEHDFIYVYRKADAARLFGNIIFRQKCFSNMYLILSGCWWVDGKNKLRGMNLLLRSLMTYPPNIFKVFKKLV